MAHTYRNHQLHLLVEVVRKYIQNQEEHHKGQTFEQEYLKMLRWHGIPFDEKCVFD